MCLDTRPISLPAKFPLPHAEISIIASAGHSVPTNDLVLQHC